MLSYINVYGSIINVERTGSQADINWCWAYTIQLLFLTSEFGLGEILNYIRKSTYVVVYNLGVAEYDEVPSLLH